MNTIGTLEKYGFYCGRMIAGSKTTYRRRYPNNFVLFNANIVTNEGKIWWGDLDITVDTPKLKIVANEAQTDLYILYEMDGRFENEKDAIEILKSKALVIFDKDGEYVWTKD